MNSSPRGQALSNAPGISVLDRKARERRHLDGKTTVLLVDSVDDWRHHNEDLGFVA